MARWRILIVDDEEQMLEVCADTLRGMSDTEIVTEKSSVEAARKLAAEHFDLLIADIRMPGLSGVDLLRAASQHDPDLLVLMLTAFPTVETAVESMKLGAADYITKPFIPDDLLATVQRLLNERMLRDENRLLQRQVDRAWRFGDIVGRSAAMQRVFDTIGRLAETDADVLIVGETGTGKELVARAIHQHSRRRAARFVTVDCAAIPEDLLESEFFGHERGAFTGAVTRSLGLIEFANQGTFFLDEIGELPSRLQVKLLRVLQERRIRRVGGTEEIEIDVRVLAATNRNLEREIAEHRFRQDLYYRINVGRIELPPLHQRAEDIPLLVSSFIERYARDMARDTAAIDSEAMEILQAYPWPGNVRELQNVIKRALAMSRSATITPDDLPEEITSGVGQRAGAADGFYGFREQRLATIEVEYLSSMLRGCEGDVARAAREAKLPRTTFYRLLKKYNIDPAAFRP